MEGSPSKQWGSRTLWIAASAVELVVILILAVGLGHFATHEKREQKVVERGTENSTLAKRTRLLDEAIRGLEACHNKMRLLEANTSTLRNGMTHISSQLERHAGEKKALQAELTILRNWTQQLQDLNNRQKEMIGHFHQQQEKLSGSSRRSRHVHFCNGLAWLGSIMVGVLFV